MSVINDMLRDLEQRKAPDREAIASVDVAQLIEPQQNNRQIYFILLIVVVAVTITFGIWMAQDQLSSRPGDAMPVVIEPPAAEVSDTSNVLGTTESVAEKAPQSLAPVTLTDVTSTLAVSSSDPLVDKSPSVVKVESAADDLVLVSTPDKAIARLTPDSQSKVIVSKKTAVQPRQERQEASSVSLNADVAEYPAVAESDAKRIVLSPKALDQQNAESAVTLFKQRNERKAYRQLFDFIATHDYDLKSRSVLAGYLLQDGRLAEAGDVLVTAPVEQDADLRQIKARWLLATGDEAMAMHTLSSNLPELEVHPDYYALLASYYQQFGYPEKAAEVYSLLVQYDASAAKWWAGLGLALDSSERFADAAQAYRQALQLPGLNRPVFDYITARMQVLKPK